MRKYLLGCICLIALAASCKKDKDMKKAVVVDTGDVANGGCGYLIRMEDDGSEKKPKYLPSMYQHDGDKILVKFDADGEGTICRTYPTNDFVELIEITYIKRNLD
jgi:hypothetical protein